MTKDLDREELDRWTKEERDEQLRLGWERHLAELSTSIAPVIRLLWTRMLEAIPGLPAPYAGAFEDGSFQMTWESVRFHFNIEIAATGEAEWFYLDRETREMSGGGFWPAERPPAYLIEQLALVSSARTLTPR